MSSATKRRIANLFGAIGYITCTLAWLWSLALYMPALLTSDAYEMFVSPAPDTAPAPDPTRLPGPTDIWLLVGLVITVLVIVVTVILFVKLPGSVARAGHSVTKKSATALTSLAVKHRPIKKAEQSRMTTQLVKLMKLALVIVPVGLTTGLRFIEAPIDSQLALLITSVLSLAALLCFTTQYITARWLKVKLSALL